MMDAEQAQLEARAVVAIAKAQAQCPELAKNWTPMMSDLARLMYMMGSNDAYKDVQDNILPKFKNVMWA